MKTLKRKKLVALSFIIIMLAVFIMQVSAAWDEVWLGDIGSGDLYCSGPWYYSTTSSTFAWDPGDEDYDFIGAFIDSMNIILYSTHHMAIFYLARSMPIIVFLKTGGIQMLLKEHTVYRGEIFTSVSLLISIITKKTSIAA